MVELKNRTLQEMARVMLHAKNLPYYLWIEALNTTCHIHNRVTIRLGTEVTHYELWKGRKPNVKYFHMFGSKCYILVEREQMRKMNHKSDEGIFLGYSINSKSYMVYNNHTKVIMESINLVVDDTPPDGTSDQNEDDVTSHEQNVTPDVPNKGIDLIHTPEDEDSEYGEDKVPTNKGSSIRI